MVETPRKKKEDVMQFEEVKQVLIRDNEEFRLLADEHRQCDEELKELSRRKYLSPEDQFHEVELKKQKLALKDRMLQMAQDYMNTTQTQ